MSDTYLPHVSVLLEECLHALSVGAEGVGKPLFADLTFGGGGHSSEILRRNPTARLIAFDRDPDAIKNGQKLLEQNGWADRAKLVHANFDQLADWFKTNQPGLFNGVLADLGVSSHQFDAGERGFSFRSDAPLDMRMDTSDDSIETAADLVNSLPEEDLANLIFKYGEERLSRRIAARICEKRKERPYRTTGELEEACFLSYPPQQRHRGAHPATRTFQALRIAVNDELGSLERMLAGLPELLAEGGTAAIISFHSLEDRIVKHTYKEIVAKSENRVTILTKKPIVPSAREVDSNPRARSAKLRVMRRTEHHGGYDGSEEQED
ncbi:MAG: 16S rRNA (cytosine(1402)-N(4))-methyltransferase RsmH [Bacteriovoracia bacterium]